MIHGHQERDKEIQIVSRAINGDIKMISETAIILANMRGGYANVGATVHTLFRMSRRPTLEKLESAERSRTAVSADAADSILKRLEASR
jgi:hypothetical protein